MRPVNIALILLALSFAGQVRSAETNTISSLPPHPRLLLSAQGVTELKQRIATESWAKAAWNELQTNAAKSLSKPVDLPPRGGNWGHNYVCPIHGARLQRGKQIGPWQWEHICPVGDHVLTGDPSKGTLDFDGNAMMDTHLNYAQQVVNDGLVFQVTGDARFAQRSREILMAYVDKYQSYPVHDNQGHPGGRGGHVASQSLTEASWLIDFVQGADLVWDTLSDADRKAIEEKVLRPALNEIIIPQKYGIHNIQCRENSAIGLTGFLLGDQQLISLAIDDRQNGYRQQLARGVNADGLWLEGSTGYHFFTIEGLWPLAEAARNCGVDLYDPQLKKMFDGPFSIAMPNLMLPNFNDSGVSPLRERAAVYELAFARFHDPKYVSLFGKRDNRMALLFGEHQVPSGQPIGETQSRNLSAGGYAVLQQNTASNTTWLALKYGPHGGGHGHPDKNTFILYSHDRILSPDGGTHAYGSPLHADWDKTSLAHDTLVVDEKSQTPAQGKCIAFGTQKGVDFAITDAGPIYSNVTFIRTVAMLSPDVVVFVDQVRSPEAHLYDLAYHQVGTWNEQPGSPWTAPELPGYKYFTHTAIQTNAVDRSMTLTTTVTNGLTGIITFLSTRSTDVITGYGILRTTEELVPMVVQRRKVDNIAFVWAVSFSGSPAKLGFEHVRSEKNKLLSRSEALVVQVDTGDLHRTLLVNPEKQTVTATLPDKSTWKTADAFSVR